MTEPTLAAPSPSPAPPPLAAPPPAPAPAQAPNGNGVPPAPAPAPSPAPAPQPEAAKPYWPEDWRQKMAEHASAGDKKAFEREMLRLARISDPAGVYGSYRE